MIGSLRGVLLERVGRRDGAAEVLIEVAGVGYRAIVPGGSASQLGALGDGIFVHVHTHVREDALILYGFATRDERVCFELLIGAHGVGPAVALALLSVHSPAALRRVVATEDVDALMLVPGIGRKTAARLLIELRSRLDLDDVADSTGAGTAAPAGTAARGEVRVALAGLGYGADEIRQALGALPADGDSASLLRLALRELATAG